jgi:signal transduction histidine kinase
MMFTTRQLLLLIAATLGATGAGSLLIAWNATEQLIAQQMADDAALILKAAAGGPVAFAHLQSAEFAQNQLEELSTNLQARIPALREVEIKGGEKQAFVYAQWGAAGDITEDCRHEIQQRSKPPGAMNVFVTRVVLDACSYRHLQFSRIWRVEAPALLLFLLGVVSAFFAATSPVWLSLKEARRRLAPALDGAPEVRSGRLTFKPIQDLVDLALRTRELEKAQRVAEFAAQVAHDIRSPLAALRIVQGQPELMSEEIRPLVGTAIERIQSIAEELLALRRARGSERETGARLESVDIRKSVHAIFLEKNTARTGMISPSDPGKCLELVDLEKAPLLGRCQSGPLERLLSNLITNALEAVETSKHPRVVVTLGRITEAPRRCVVWIVDNGPGIPDHILARVGERGFTSGKTNGNGLGVHHAKTTLESWGGELNITSGEGKGTQLRLTIPEV